MKQKLLLLVFVLVFSSCGDNEIDCPEGFTGVDCTQELQPRIVTASKVEIANLPSLRPDGRPWDSITNPLPDPLIEIEGFGLSGFIGDLAEDEVATYVLGAFAIDLTKETKITIFDNDTSPTDPVIMIEKMDSFSFPAYEKGMGFPSSISRGDAPQVTLFLEYDWRQ